MSVILVIGQTLNGIQLGMMFFMIAAGMSLVFGIMNLLNLAHGSLYTLRTYLAVTDLPLSFSSTRS